jgi:hypothetical protein
MITDATIQLADLGNTCTGGQIMKSSGLGLSWYCSADADTTYAAGNGLILGGGNMFSVNFGGTGVANSSARSDHNHWGASWSGSGTGLTLSGGTTGLYSLGTTYGVSGYSATQTGVHGAGGPYGVEGTGSTYGVHGYGGPTGVRGDGDTYGVYGYSADHYGVYGYSASQIGVHGEGGPYGVEGTGSTYGVHGVSGSTGVKGDGVNYGVYGYSVNGRGVYGFSGTDAGVSGEGATGVIGAGSDYGVYGVGTNYGVYGHSASGTGVIGAGSDYGVYGGGSAGDGVRGVSTDVNHAGVSGEGPTGVYGRGGYGGNVGVEGSTSSGIGDYAGLFYGNVRVVGNQVVTGSKSAAVHTKDYGTRALYSVESPGNWFEDYGTGQLTNGAAVITIEPIFAETVNLTQEYHVFITPLGDCALYVEGKTPASFSVRAMGRNTCSASFDYRIVAKRLGFEDQRLAEVSAPPAPADAH